MRTRPFERAGLVALLLLAAARPGLAQTAARPTGVVSLYLDTASRQWDDGARQRDTELSTAITLESPRTEENGVEYGLQLRHTRVASGRRPDRVSIYDGFVGGRVGGSVQLRVRGGHMWLPDLGTMGSLAGGLIEIAQRREPGGSGVRVGAFSGLEPRTYDTGYVPEVRKQGAYVAYESGYQRRHVVGYTSVRQGDLNERSVLSAINFVPAGRSFFAYQAAEFEVKGPAGGAADSGLSYFLTNVRVSPSPKLQLLGSYNRGRSIDARRLAEDVINGRPLTAQAVEGLQYESMGGRVTVEVAPRARVYAGYTQSRNNRDDVSTPRITIGGHAGDVAGTGLDISASDTRVDRPDRPYHSSYLSIGRGIGRSTYLSLDYTTSLSVVRFQRSDGVVIETRPSTRRISGSGTVTLGRHVTLSGTVDYTVDRDLREVRVLSGLSLRL